MWTKEKSKTVKGFIDAFLVGEQHDYIEDILDHLKSLYLNDEEPEQITAVEMLAIRDKLGARVSNLAVTRFATYIEMLLKRKKLLKNNNGKIFQSQLRKRMGKEEREGTIPIRVVQIECQTSKEESGMVNYYFIENVPLVMERLASCSITDGSFRPSFELSSFEDKMMFKVGCDRGGGNVINMILFMNRKNGNSGKYSFPIDVVEGALETYSNLKKTVYSDDRKKILEDLLNKRL